MGKQYQQSKPEKRATLMLMRQEGSSMRAVGRKLQRSPSSISRELARYGVEEDRSYEAVVAGQRAPIGVVASRIQLVHVLPVD